MRTFWNIQKEHKKLAYISAGIGIIALVAIIVAIIITGTKKVVDPVVLKIGDTEIRQSKYEGFIAEGKKYKIPEQDVRKTLIEYEKNKIAAKDKGITVDVKYPKIARDHMLRQQLTDKNKRTYDYTALDSATGEFVDMMTYNTAFDVRLNAIQIGGYSLVAFDFPTVINPFQGADASKAATKEQAEDFRKQVISGQVVGDKAIDQAAQLNNAAGRSSLSNYYLVSDNPTGLNAGISGTGIQTYGFLTKFMSTLKQTGISDVSVTQDNDYFFVDYLYHDKANPAIMSQVTKIKNQVRVVEYDK